MKRKITATILACSLILSSQVSYAASSTTMMVGSKNVAVNSTITRNSGAGYTGSDGTIYSKVSVTYIYKKSGVTYTKKNTTGYTYSVASASCSAASGGTSVQVKSQHEAIYKGNYNSKSTSKSY